MSATVWATATPPLISSSSGDPVISRVLCLVDSGSGSTIVSNNTVEHLRLPVIRSSQDASLVATLADGRSIPILGTTHLTITINDVRYDIQHASVLPSLNQCDVILGLPFIVDHRVRFSSTGIRIDDNNAIAYANTDSALRVCYVGTTTSDGVPEELIRSFPTVFDPPSGVPTNHPFQATIDLKPGAVPIARRHYPIPPRYREPLLAKLRDMEQRGWIVPSSSPWAAPLLVVPKKNGDIRIVVDYRGLNEQTIIPDFPLPRAEELFESLCNARIFTKLDFDSGYHQMALSPESRPLTAFTSMFGKWEFNVLAQGTSGSGAQFQRLQTTVLRDHIGKYCIVFLDDILIYSANQATHEHEHVPAVMASLAKYNLHVKPSKCLFSVTSVDFLGHHISVGKIEPLQSNIQPIADFPEPKSSDEVRRFVAMAGFYRRFIKNFASIASPLHALQDKKIPALQLNDLEREAFLTLKTLLISKPILCIFDPTKPTRLETDASQTALGAVLMQQQADSAYHPVLFHSRKLNAAETNYSATDRELLAIVDFLKRHSHLTPLSNEIEVLTDHRILQHLLTKPVLRPREQGWLDLISSVKLKIQYREGSAAAVPDALSRIHVNAIATSAFTNDSTLRRMVLEGVAKHPKFGPLYTKLQSGLTMPAFFIRSDLLFLRDSAAHGRLVVLHPRVQRWLLESYHDGHPGINAMYMTIRQHFYWPRLHTDVLHYVAGCQTCQLAAQQQHTPPSIIDSPPAQRWEEISIDYALGLPRSLEGFDQITVVVDRLSHRVVIYPAITSDTADVAAQRFLNHVIAYFGWPRVIISDHDKIFMSKFWSTLCTLSRIKMRMASVGHHRGNGSAENAIKRLRDKLRKHAITFDDEWPKFLPSIMIALNKYVSPTLGQSPFKLDTGRDFHSPVDRLVPRGDTGHPAIDEHQRILDAATDQHIADQVRNLTPSSAPAPSRTAPLLPTLRPGDRVLLSTAIVTPPASHAAIKLRSTWIGPFTVSAVDQFNHVTLTDLPRNWRITNPVHRDFVRPYTPPQPHQPALPSDPYLGNWLGSDTRQWIIKSIASHSDQNQRDIAARIFYVEYSSPPGEFAWLHASDIPPHMVREYNDRNPPNGFFNPVGGYRGQDLEPNDPNDRTYRPPTRSSHAPRGRNHASRGRGRGRPTQKGEVNG